MLCPLVTLPIFLLSFMLAVDESPSLVQLTDHDSLAIGKQSSLEHKKIDESVRVLDGAVLFETTELRVDADGAPSSYLVNGKGLSATCDGVAAIVNGRALTTKDKNWQPLCRSAWAKAVATNDYSQVRIFGFSHDSKTNHPILQKNGDPNPDIAYRTETTLHIDEAPKESQSYYVDATRIPYIVLPGSFESRYAVVPGDIAVAYRPKTGVLAFAVFGDVGGKGEASVKLHLDLGNQPETCSYGVNRANGNIEDPVLTVVFPGSKVQPSLNAEDWIRRIQTVGSTSLEKWGGISRLRTIVGGPATPTSPTPSTGDPLDPCSNRPVPHHPQK